MKAISSFVLSTVVSGCLHFVS